MLRLALALGVVALLACGGEDASEADPAAEVDLESPGEPVELPFAIDESSPDLLLTYADESGAHTVHRPSEVPEGAREWVRVDSLSLAPEQRPAEGRVYVADLRERAAGSRDARLVPRAVFDAYVERASGSPRPAAGASGSTATGATSDQIVLYGASWCGACRQARQFFEREGIAFVDRDIERDPGAREEMTAKARAAGVSVGGIPVIDVRGTIVPGFDERRIRRLLAASPGAAPAPAATPQPI